MKYFVNQYKKVFMMGVVSRLETSVPGGANEVINKINRLSNDVFTIDEKKEINRMIQKKLLEASNLDEKKIFLENIIEYLGTKEIIKSEENLKKLKQELEEKIKNIEKSKIIPEYGMEGLRSRIDKESAFGKILNYEFKGFNGFDFWLKNRIDEKLKISIMSPENKNLSDKIGVIIWKKIVNDIGLKSGTSFLVNPILEKIKGFSERIKKFGKEHSSENNNEEQANFGLSDLKGIFKSVKEFDETNEDNDKIIIQGKEIPLPKGFKKLFGYLDSLVKTDFNNLKLLMDLAKTKKIENKESFKNILDNPQILEKVLETGEYNKNGFDINLKEGKIIFGKNDKKTIEEAKKKFMDEAIKLTKKTSQPIDEFLGMFKETASFFKDLGFDSNEIKEFAKGLFEIPIIGALLKMLLGKFFDGVSEELENSEIDDKYKKIAENFEKFILKAKVDELPFKLEKTKDGKENKKLEKSDFDNINKFLKNIEKEEKKHKSTESILKDKNILEKLFIEKLKDTDNKIVKQIKIEIAKIRGTGGEKLSKKEFFKQLTKINLDVSSQVSSKEEEKKSEKTLQNEVQKKQETEEQKAKESKILASKKQIEKEQQNLLLEIAGLKEGKKILKEEEKKLQEELKKVNSELEGLNKKISALEKENKGIDKEIIKKEKEFEKNKSKLKKIKEEDGGFLTNNNYRKGQLNGENNKLKSEIETLRKKKKENDINIQKIKLKIGKFNEELGGKAYGELSMKKEKLEIQIQEKQKAIKIIDKKLGEISTKKKEIDGKSKKIDEEVKQIKIKDELSKFEADLKTKPLEEIKKEKTNIDGKINENNKKLEEIKKEVMNLNATEKNLSKLENLGKEKKQLEKENEILKSKKEIVEKVIKQKEEIKQQSPEVIKDKILTQLEKATEFPIKLSDGREIKFGVDKGKGFLEGDPFNSYYISIGKEKFEIKKAMGMEGATLNVLLTNINPKIEFKNNKITVLNNDIPKEKFNQTLLSLIETGKGQLKLGDKMFEFGKV